MNSFLFYISEKLSCAPALMVKTTEMRILPGRARGRKHFVDAEIFHSIAKSTAIAAVSVTQPVAWSGIEGKGLHQLLCCPGSNNTGQLDVRSR
jgi:hypothetical protein